MAKQTVRSTKTATTKKNGIFAKKLLAKTTKDGFRRAGGKFESYTQLNLAANPNQAFEMYLLKSEEIHSDKFETGSALLHIFLMKETGEIVQVWGSGQLNYLLAEIEPGTLVRVAWTDKVKIQLKGTKKKVMANQYEVEYNAEDTVEVSKYI